jgi:NDP-sugar pyrophosphorylase family protein
MEVCAAILAGGLGTRLRNVVADRPKVLAEVNGRPYLTFILEQLSETGLTEVILLTGYRGDQVRQTLGDRYRNLRLTYSQEPRSLGTGGAVRWAAGLFTSETLLLLNGDSYCGVDLDLFWKFHRRRPARASLVLARVADPSRFGQVKLGTDSRVLGFREKVKSTTHGWINAGIYLLDRLLIEEVSPGCPISLERELIPAWVGRRVVFGLPCDQHFLDIGTPESYSLAGEFFGRPAGQPEPRREEPASC